MNDFHPDIICGTGYSPTAPSEEYVFGRDNRTLLNNSRKGCIIGAGKSTPATGMMLDNIERYLGSDPVMSIGIPCFCSDNGGGDTWGNDTAVARYAEGLTFFKTLGVHQTKGFRLGVSMGGLETLNSIWNIGGQGVDSSAEVERIVLVLPAANPQRLYDDNTSYKSSIEIAWGGRPSNAVTPYNQAGTGWANSGNVGTKRGQLYYSDDDVVFPQAEALDFVSILGSNWEAISIGAHGHSSLTLPIWRMLRFFAEGI